MGGEPLWIIWNSIDIEVIPCVICKIQQPLTGILVLLLIDDLNLDGCNLGQFCKFKNTWNGNIFA